MPKDATPGVAQATRAGTMPLERCLQFEQKLQNALWLRIHHQRMYSSVRLGCVCSCYLYDCVYISARLYITVLADVRSPVYEFINAPDKSFDNAIQPRARSP